MLFRGTINIYRIQSKLKMYCRFVEKGSEAEWMLFGSDIATLNTNSHSHRTENFGAEAAFGIVKNLDDSRSKNQFRYYCGQFEGQFGDFRS